MAGMAGTHAPTGLQHTVCSLVNFYHRILEKCYPRTFEEMVTIFTNRSVSPNSSHKESILSLERLCGAGYEIVNLLLQRVSCSKA